MNERSSRWLLAIAVLVSLLATLLGQHDRELWAPDEVREAGISRAMARTGDWVTPRLNGRAFLEKPPLFHSAAAAVFAATGSDSRFVARVPAILFALLTLAMVYALGREVGGRRTGALAVLILATMVGFFLSYHRAVTDNAIPPFLTLAFLAYSRALAPGRSAWWFALTGLALGLTFLVKGLVGPAIFVAGALVHLAWTRDLKAPFRPRLLLSFAAFAVPVAIWLVLLHQREGMGAVRTVLIDNNWKRATSGDADHAGPPWFYLQALPGYLMPWAPVLLLAGWRLARRGGAGRWRRAALPAAWLVGGFLLLSIASAKRPIYTLPLLPGGAVVVALALEPLLLSRRSRLAKPISLGLAGLACLGLLVAAGFDLSARRDDVLWVGLAVVSVAAGAWLAGRFRLVFLIFVPATLATVLALRYASVEGNKQKGFEQIAADVAASSEGRTVVLFRASEALRGALVYYLDRELPETYMTEDLREFQRWNGNLNVTVVAEDTPANLTEILGPGGRVVVAPREIRRTTFTIALYDPLGR
jgi:4-amino-4-deoxy-L-arabinose transferase-like glycosyltransferase